MADRETKKKDPTLSEALASVPESGTSVPEREQIEYIDIDLLDSDANNFYELSGIDELASNIQLLGLQQPIRIRAADDGRYVIVSGHRRCGALRKLIEEGAEQFKSVPCILDKQSGSQALQELRMIFANSDTRKMSAADISKQAERVEMLLYELKREGYEFPGRMRDHVAEACKVSKSKLSRLKVIRDGLTPKLKKQWDKGELNEAVAYALARHEVDFQDRFLEYRSKNKYNSSLKYLSEITVKDGLTLISALLSLECPDNLGGGPCSNVDRMLEKCASDPYEWTECGHNHGCCAACSKLASCKFSCPKFADKVKQLKADAKAAKKQQADAQAERDRPVIEEIQKYWQRFGLARAVNGVSVKDCFTAVSQYYANSDEGKVEALESLQVPFSTTTSLPYGYYVNLSAVRDLVSLADCLGVSLDYLLCRTDDPVNGAERSCCDKVTI